MFDLPPAISTIDQEIEKETQEPFLTVDEQVWLGEVKQEFDESLEAEYRKIYPLESRESTENALEDLYNEIKAMQLEAGKDRLTHLENRRGLFLRGAAAFNDVEKNDSLQGKMTVMSLDIDFFKAYNEVSHTFGDLALQSMAHVLLQASKEVGFSVRLGGEEIFF